MTLQDDENEDKNPHFILWKLNHTFTAVSAGGGFFFGKGQPLANFGGMAEHHDDRHYLKGITGGDTRVFADFFEEYYPDLVMFCGNYVRNLHSCEDIVVSVFVHIWETGPDFRIDRSLKSYLLAAVRNRALNELRHHRVRNEHSERILSGSVLEDNGVEDYIFYSELKRDYAEAVAGLPEPVRKTFLMFMEEDMKTRDISESLNITQRAVELRLKKAFALIRDGLTHGGGAALILICLLSGLMI